jgi:hypothetical protein
MSSTDFAHPEATEYGPGFGSYIQLVTPCDVPAFLEAQSADLQNLLQGLSEHESLVHHAPYTWSIRQVVGHVTDCERVFGYRAMRIARNDPTPLPTFDDQPYVRVANFDRRHLTDLLDEFAALRRSHIMMLRHLEPEAWFRRGVVNDAPMSVRAMAYSIAGHAKHHLDILHKRLA